MATKDLCRLYGHDSPDQALCITYSLHQVVLLRHSRDREQEGDALEAVSRLYLTVATERCVGTVGFAHSTVAGCPSSCNKNKDLHSYFNQLTDGCKSIHILNFSKSIDM